MSEREMKFEQMLTFVQQRYEETCSRMETLKAQGKEKSATYRQLFADKLTYKNMLDLYRLHGLLP